MLLEIEPRRSWQMLLFTSARTSPVSATSITSSAYSSVEPTAKAVRGSSVRSASKVSCNEDARANEKDDSIGVASLGLFSKRCAYCANLARRRRTQFWCTLKASTWQNIKNNWQSTSDKNDRLLRHIAMLGCVSKLFSDSKCLH